MAPTARLKKNLTVQHVYKFYIFSQNGGDSKQIFNKVFEQIVSF